MVRPGCLSSASFSGWTSSLSSLVASIHIFHSTWFLSPPLTGSKRTLPIALVAGELVAKEMWQSMKP